MVNLKSSLLFSSTSAVLQPAAVEQIAQLSDILVPLSGGSHRDPGPHDSTGSAAHDEELSLRRAEAVRDVLRWSLCGGAVKERDGGMRWCCRSSGAGGFSIWRLSRSDVWYPGPSPRWQAEEEDRSRGEFFIAHSFPPWASVIEREIASPMPIPRTSS